MVAPSKLAGRGGTPGQATTPRSESSVFAVTRIRGCAVACDRREQSTSPGHHCIASSLAVTARVLAEAFLLLYLRNLRRSCGCVGHAFQSRKGAWNEVCLDHWNYRPG